MLTKEQLEIEINLLQSLPYTNAYTGVLGDLQQKSYVDYTHILTLLNEKRILINSYLKEISSYKDFKEGMKLYDLVYNRVLYINKSNINGSFIIESKDHNPLFSHWIREEMDYSNYKIIN